MKKQPITFLLFFSFLPIFADQSCFLKEESSQNSATVSKPEVQEDDNSDEFWWTGPLLASSATTVEPGTFVVAPYLICYQTYGVYNRNWDLLKIPTLNTLNPFCLVQTGLTDCLDVTFYFQAFNNWARSNHYFGFGDSTIKLKYLAFKANEKSPNVALFLQETFPTGSYHHLSPDFLTLDSTGGGAYVTSAGLYLDNQFKLSDGRWFKWYLNLSYNIASTVSVEGTSIYGGGRGTRGTVRPGDSFIAIASCERQITQEWVLALDVLYKHTNKSTFNGILGQTKAGEIAKVGLPSSESVSIAPAIEYNIDNRKGIIFGVWFSVQGRNSPAFYSPTLSCYFTY